MQPRRYKVICLCLCLCLAALSGYIVSSRALQGAARARETREHEATGGRAVAQAQNLGAGPARSERAGDRRGPNVRAFWDRKEREHRPAEAFRLFKADEYPGVPRQKRLAGDVSRNCFVVDRDTVIERELDCRPGRRLAFWVSAAFPFGAESRGRVALEVITIAGPSADTVLERAWQSDRPAPEWDLVTLDLSPVAEGSVTLRLVVTIRQDGPAWPVRPACLISEPMVVDPEPPDRPNVVLITVETLRRDHLTIHGYPRSTAPFLEELAREAVVLDGALSQSCWTRPSIASILTGLYPSQHGMLGTLDRMADNAVLLPELLRASGYTTGGFLTNRGVSRPSQNYDQGFDTFSDERYRVLDDVVDDILSWLSAVPAQPFFLYVHTMDPHSPYDAPIGFRDMFAAEPPSRLAALASLDLPELHSLPSITAQEVEYVVSRYDDEIAYTNHVLQRFVRELKARGLWDNTLFVLTADHGEELHEHGRWGHRLDLMPEKLRIPLIVKLPGGAHGGLRLGGLASGVDIAPTVLSAVGLPDPDHLPGRDLLASLETGTTGRSLHFAEYWPEPSFVVSEAHYAVVSETAQFIQTVPVARDTKATQRLFDLTADPAAQHNLAAERPHEVSSWARLLDRRYRTGCTLAACGADARSTFSGQARSSVPIVEFETTSCEPGDSAHLSEDRRTLQFSLAVSAADDDVVWFRTDPDCAELEVDVALDGAPPPLDAIRLGPLAIPAEALPVRLPAARSPADTALAAGRRYGRCPRPVLYLWRTGPCFTRAEGQPQPDEETLRTLKDLGYL